MPVNPKNESVKIDGKLLAQYRAASKKTGIRIGKLVTDAMTFFPLKKFVDRIMAERERLKNGQDSN